MEKKIETTCCQWSPWALQTLPVKTHIQKVVFNLKYSPLFSIPLNSLNDQQ